MTDHDDELKRRYRELATEEPSAVIDAAILAASRRRRPWIARWAGPVSIAAVLVLGIGVSLRMQLEQPGIESSAPETQSMEMSRGFAPATPPPQPVPEPSTKDEARRDAFVPSPPAEKKKLAPPQELKERLAAPAPAPAREANVAPARPAPQATTSAIVVAPPPAPAAAPPPAALGRVYSDEARPQAQAAPAIRAEPAQAPLRAKQEAESDRAARVAGAAADSAGMGARAVQKSIAETDPVRELERIAKLREAGDHAAADKALDEFRKRFPDFRIPEATWEKVRPR